jgi:dienelactone hydrolase
VLLALVVSAAAVSSPGLADAAAAQEGGDSLDGRYFEPVFDEMTITKDDISYGPLNNNGEPLLLDVYEPAGDTAEIRPLIVLLHGGYFKYGSHDDEAYGGGPGVAQTFTDMGYVVASVGYRLRPGPEMPLTDVSEAPPEVVQQYEDAVLDAHDDVAAAIGWLRDHSAELRIDPDAIVPHGVSAGGIIAWNLAWLPGSSARPDPVGVAAAVSVAGLPWESSLITGEPWAAASPGDAPVLAYNGTLDPIMKYDEFVTPPCERAAAADVRCELVTFEGLGHPAVGGGDAFTDRFWASLDITTAFLAEEVLIPLGYVDEVPTPGDPPPTPPTTPPSTDGTPPPSPGGEPPQATPVARPARPVIADPTYTG